MNNIIFFGNERLATGLESTSAPTLEALIKHGYLVKAVVSNYEPARSRNSRELEVAKIANRHNIPLLLPKSLKDIKGQLESCNANIGILVAYGKIIPESIINLFEYGIINVHPSLLPHYRGPTPIEQAMLDGASKTGVSIMHLTKAMDEGPIYVQRTIRLTGQEQKNELSEALLTLGSDLVIEYLPRIISRKTKPYKQPHPDRATYTNKISKQSGVIDWRKPAIVLEREVRAYLGWPGSQTVLKGKQIIVTEVGVRLNTSNNHKPGEFFITKDGQLAVQARVGLLIIKRLKPSGKKEMTGAEFARGNLR